jgi:syntaxin 16
MDTNDNSLSLFQQDKLKKEAEMLDKEIDNLADNVTNIYALFKQMNEVVYEQGQVVDRIDYNITEGLKHVKKGNTELVKAKEYAESKCAQRFIRCQLLCVSFLTILILIKYI